MESSPLAPPEIEIEISGEIAAGAPYDAAIESVLAVFPKHSVVEIAADLKVTKSVEKTVDRILNGDFLQGTELDPSLSLISETPRRSSRLNEHSQTFALIDEQDLIQDLPASPTPKRKYTKRQPKVPEEEPVTQEESQPSEQSEPSKKKTKSTSQATGEEDIALEMRRRESRERRAQEKEQRQKKALDGEFKKRLSGVLKPREKNSSETILDDMVAVLESEILTLQHNGPEFVKALRGIPKLTLTIEPGLALRKSIEWRRKVQPEESSGKNREDESGKNREDEIGQENSRTLVPENYVLYWEDMRSFLQRTGPTEQRDFAKAFQRATRGKHAIYLLEGLKSHITQLLKDLSQSQSPDSKESVAIAIRKIEEHLLVFQRDLKCSIIKSESIEESAYFIKLITESIATAPTLKTEDLEQYATTVVNSRPSLGDIWKSQLESINHITPAMADLIAQRYSSARKLVREFQVRSTGEAEDLLAELLNDRDLSRLVYRAFMEENPQASLE